MQKAAGVVWECDVEGEWVAYLDEIQSALERDFQLKTVSAFDLQGSRYTVDFKTGAPAMQQNIATRYKRELRRRVEQPSPSYVFGDPAQTKFSATVPPCWAPHGSGEDCRLVDLQKTSVEWKMVETELCRSIPNATLVEVQRVQNLPLWEYYIFRRDRVAKLSGKNIQGIMWHGTGTVDPKTICLDKSDGFMMQCSSSGLPVGD
jgi:WWE domain